jgi:hypothetical protein
MSEKTAKPHVKMPRGQWFSVLDVRFYERPSEDPEKLEIWCYTDRLSYSPGDSVSFHVSTTAKEYEIEIVRDGYRQEVVAQLRVDRGQTHETPPDASVRGCGWPVACHWRIPADTRSGGYVVIARTRGNHGELREQHHFFIVRPVARSHAKLLLIASTCTWTAYNDWGGSNHYEGISGSSGDEHSPVLSTLRPFSRGLIWLPVGAPRIPVDGLPTHSIPRYRRLVPRPDRRWRVESPASAILTPSIQCSRYARRLHSWDSWLWRSPDSRRRLPEGAAPHESDHPSGRARISGRPCGPCRWKSRLKPEWLRPPDSSLERDACASREARQRITKQEGEDACSAHHDG